MQALVMTLRSVWECEDYAYNQLKGSLDERRAALDERIDYFRYLLELRGLAYFHMEVDLTGLSDVYRGRFLDSALLWKLSIESRRPYVDDSITSLIRTSGPVLTVHGAWAQNIGESEMYIDFMGDKAGIRLAYGQDFTLYTVENNALIRYTPTFPKTDHFQNEINAFVRCVQTGEKLPSHIDTAIITSRIMQAIYDSSEQHREIAL